MSAIYNRFLGRLRWLDREIDRVPVPAVRSRAALVRRRDRYARALYYLSGRIERAG